MFSFLKDYILQDCRAVLTEPAVAPRVSTCENCLLQRGGSGPTAWSRIAIFTVFEYSPVTGRHYSRKEVDFDLERNTWKALSIEVGGERGTHRILKVVMLKKENALKAYFDQLQYEFRGMNPQPHVPGFKALSPDIRQCASITVKRG